MNLQQFYAIQQKNRERLLRCFPDLPDTTGIYILTREEDGEKFAYIGQSVKILTRMASHLNGYQHIDLSMKKHGLYSESNLNGWKIDFFNCSKEELDLKEKEQIQEAQTKGYQLLNKTLGGQGKGKIVMDNIKPSRGYHDGLKQGRKNCKKEILKLFQNNLIYSINGQPNKNKEKALQKFKDFLSEND